MDNLQPPWLENDSMQSMSNMDESLCIETDYLPSPKVKQNIHTNIDRNEKVTIIKMVSEQKEKVENNSSFVTKMKDFQQKANHSPSIDKKVLSESLLNAFTPLSLNNLLTPQKSANNVTEIKSQEKENNKVNETLKINKIESKLTFPSKPLKNKKILIKNLKLKNDKVDNKGPLKAVIPVINMEKTRKSKC